MGKRESVANPDAARLTVAGLITIIPQSFVLVFKRCGLNFFRKSALRLRWALTSLRDWSDYRKHQAAFLAKARDTTVKRIESPLGERTRHVYQIAGSATLTTFQLHQRHGIIESLYPSKLTSLLDIGCCRGWFVIKAAERPECERATGIDVVPGFIDAANEAKAALGQDKADFHYAFLDDLIADPRKFRTPYQTLILLNTYHYMYWGSAYSPRHWADHDYLLRSLAAVCTDRMIFMGPLEVDECPADIAERAKAHPDWGAAYTTATFMDVASRYFHVTHHSNMGERPVYVLTRKTSPA